MDRASLAVVMAADTTPLIDQANPILALDQYLGGANLHVTGAGAFWAPYLKANTWT